VECEVDTQAKIENITLLHTPSVLNKSKNEALNASPLPSSMERPLLQLALDINDHSVSRTTAMENTW